VCDRARKGDLTSLATVLVSLSILNADRLESADVISIDRTA
jgi:hypothetical protein